MPTINLRGIGKVKTTKKLPKGLKRRGVFGFKRQGFRLVFALNNLAKGERGRLRKRFEKISKV